MAQRCQSHGWESERKAAFVRIQSDGLIFYGDKSDVWDAQKRVKREFLPPLFSNCLDQPLAPRIFGRSCHVLPPSLRLAQTARGVRSLRSYSATKYGSGNTTVLDVNILQACAHRYTVLSLGEVMFCSLTYHSIKKVLPPVQ